MQYTSANFFGFESNSAVHSLASGLAILRIDVQCEIRAFYLARLSENI